MRPSILFDILLQRLDARRLRKSASFDVEFYKNAYSDVSKSGLDPALHYARIGGKELRRPAAEIDVRPLLRLAPRFKPGHHNPVLFIEDRLMHAKPAPQASINPDEFLQHMRRSVIQLKPSSSAPTDIIVPVHNNLAKFERLLLSLERHTDPIHPIIIIDDASSDPNVQKRIAQFADGRENISVVRNQKNLGYPASVNIGIHRSSNHKIVLNSDTVVPAGWVDELVGPIANDPQIASVTPYSNASTYTGFPENRIELPIESDAELEQINHALSRFDALHEEVLCGVGFCMAVNSAAVDAIGGFDEELFKDGYYEETHWCYRAYKAGFKNVLANRLFVIHDHTSASYGLRRKLRALRRSERRMKQVFPEYFTQMDAFYFTDPHRSMRVQYGLAVSSHLTPNAAALLKNGVGPPRRSQKRALIAISRELNTSLYLIYENTNSWSVEAVTPKLDPVLFQGTLANICQLLAELKATKLLFSASCRPETVRVLRQELSKHGVKPDLTELKPENGNSIRIGDWRKYLSKQRADPTIRIAVFGCGQVAKAPRIVRRFVEHAVGTEPACNMLVFGEISGLPIAAPTVAKTGFFGLQNIPAILRHYCVNVAYFAQSKDALFPSTLRTVIDMAIPALSHDKGPLGKLAPSYAGWSVSPQTQPEETLARLMALRKSQLNDLEFLLD